MKVHKTVNVPCELYYMSHVNNFLFCLTFGKSIFFYLLACLFSFSISMPMLFLIKLGLDEEKKNIYEFVI